MFPFFVQSLARGEKLYFQGKKVLNKLSVGKQRSLGESNYFGIPVRACLSEFFLLKILIWGWGLGRAYIESKFCVDEEYSICNTNSGKLRTLSLRIHIIEALDPF